MRLFMRHNVLIEVEGSNPDEFLIKMNRFGPLTAALATLALGIYER